MKHLIFNHFIIASLLLAVVPAAAQPLSATDAVAMLNELPAPPTTLEEAFQQAYPNNTSRPDAKPHYKRWFDKIEKTGLENRQLQMQFYQKNPTDLRPVAQPVSQVTPQQQNSMNAATSELAQKMLTDPAFAQKFSKMSEQEQHAYIAGLLAEKGLKPVNGTPNVNTAPVPGTDVEWATLCTEYMQTATDISRWEKQTALQQQYENKHQEVRDWAEAAIKKLPMYSFGEYGHDHDPEQLKSVQKEALSRHRDVAAAMWLELRLMLQAFRQEAAQRVTPLNDALKQVGFGARYDFGIHYTTVLGAQSMMIQEAHALLSNEITMIEEVARWEYEWRNFK